MIKYSIENDNKSQPNEAQIGVSPRWTSNPAGGDTWFLVCWDENNYDQAECEWCDIYSVRK